MKKQTLNPHQLEQVNDAGAMYGGVIRKAFIGKVSPRQAIKAFCLHCTGYVRKDVTNCTALACPLFAYRPYQAGDESDAEPSEEMV